MNGMPADSPPTSLPKPPLRLPSRWWWPRRLHQQLVWIVSALLVLALSVLGGYTAHEQAQVSRRAVENQAAALARNVAVASANLILTDSLDGLEELVARSVDVGETRSLSVIDVQGVALAQALRSPRGDTQVVYGRAQPVRLALPQPVSSGGGAMPRVFQQGDWIVAWHPIQVGGLIGWVRVEHDTVALVEGQRRPAQEHQQQGCAAAHGQHRHHRGVAPGPPLPLDQGDGVVLDAHPADQPADLDRVPGHDPVALLKDTGHRAPT